MKDIQEMLKRIEELKAGTSQLQTEAVELQNELLEFVKNGGTTGDLIKDIAILCFFGLMPEDFIKDYRKIQSKVEVNYGELVLMIKNYKEDMFTCRMPPREPLPEEQITKIDYHLGILSGTSLILDRTAVLNPCFFPMKYYSMCTDFGHVQKIEGNMPISTFLDDGAYLSFFDFRENNKEKKMNIFIGNVDVRGFFEEHHRVKIFENLYEKLALAHTQAAQEQISK